MLEKANCPFCKTEIISNYPLGSLINFRCTSCTFFGSKSNPLDPDFSGYQFVINNYVLVATKENRTTTIYSNGEKMCDLHEYLSLEYFVGTQEEVWSKVKMLMVF